VHLNSNADRTVSLELFGTDKKLAFYNMLYGWMLESPGFDAVIAEDFKVRPVNAKSGSFDWNRMPAPQVLRSVGTFRSSVKDSVRTSTAVDKTTWVWVSR